MAAEFASSTQEMFPAPVVESEFGPLTKNGNQFQFSRDTLEQMMEIQIGAVGSAPLDALSGYWDGKERFSFTIVSVVRDRSTPFVAVAKCDDGLFLDCTASFLMRADVNVSWKSVDESTFVDGRILESPWCARGRV